MADRVEITCPCCETQLVVDADSGEILSEERPKKNLEKSFEGAMSQVRGGEGRRAQAFDKAFDRQQKLDEVLEKKFEEARKKAEKDPKGKPRNPLDWD